MKTFTRIMALVLALMMVAVIVAGCTEVEIDEVDYVDASKDASGRQRDDLDQYNLNYLNETISILHWSDVEKPEFEEKELTNDNVRDAIFDRNNQIQKRLRVELTFHGEAGNSSHRASFVRYVSNIHESGGAEYDIIACYARTMGNLSVQGLLVNFGEIETSYMNLKQPWWPQQMVDTVSFGIPTEYSDSSYYFISGDCSTNILYQMVCLYFNKDEINARFNREAQAYVQANPDKADTVTDGTTLLYDYVYEGQWTLDKLIEMTTDTWRDAGGEQANVKSTDDFFGFVTVNYMYDAFYTGANLRFVEQDSTDVLKISSDFGSRRTVQLVQRLGGWVTSNDVLSTASYGTIFSRGGALFILTAASYAENSLSRSDAFDFGLVPTPKYDTAQLNYYTKTGNPITMYGIFIDCPNHFLDDGKQETYSMLTAVLECWCSEGYRLTTPEIFEVNMQLKMSETDNETQMFEYVRSGITYDLGRYFTDDLSAINELFSGPIISNSPWASTYNQYKNRLNEQMKAIVDGFKEYVVANQGH